MVPRTAQTRRESCKRSHGVFGAGNPRSASAAVFGCCTKERMSEVSDQNTISFLGPKRTLTFCQIASGQVP
jgi:hypothetical protein